MDSSYSVNIKQDTDGVQDQTTFCFYIAIIRYHLALQQSPYVQIMNLNSCGMYHNALISVELMALSMNSGT